MWRMERTWILLELEQKVNLPGAGYPQNVEKMARQNRSWTRQPWNIMMQMRLCSPDRPSG
jgi:hypothetical protein